MTDRATVLVSIAELAESLLDPHPAVLLDVRWALGDPDGLAHYRNGHLPGAFFVDLDRELAAAASVAGGRHPLPDLAALQATARSWGLRAQDRVVVYDNSGGLAAARAWWLLRWAGVGDVRLLDGGLRAWIDAGHGLFYEEPVPVQPGDVLLSPGHLPILTADEAAARARSGLLLDARAAERYRGEVEPVDARAGHIPGAVSAPTTMNIGADDRFLPSDQLREQFRAIGVTDGTSVGVYCGSGVTAAHQIVALAVVGVPAALYPGSWSAWSGNPHRPIATGADPG